MYRITDECIACGLCVRACPVGAVVESDPIAFAVTNDCDDCKNQLQQLCVEVCPVECIVIDYTESELLAGLRNKDTSVRLAFAKVNSRIKLPAEVVESGLTDPCDGVRAAFAARADLTPSAFQIERGLTDVAAEVRSSFARRGDISMSPAQIERGLLDPSDGVRGAISKRPDFTPSAFQIERALFDSNISVRCNFIERADCQITDEQFERLKYDSSAAVQVCLHHKRQTKSV